MCSSLVENGSETLFQALEAGAVDVILKPRMGVADHLAEQHRHVHADGSHRLRRGRKSGGTGRDRTRGAGGGNAVMATRATGPSPEPMAVEQDDDGLL
jgi:two-component system chemotaxis response regulator CheB